MGWEADKEEDEEDEGEERALSSFEDLEVNDKESCPRGITIWGHPN